jgi:hypothetical protein
MDLAVHRKGDDMDDLYEPPELFELGEIADLTLAHRIGSWPDGSFNGWTREPSPFEGLPEEE